VQDERSGLNEGIIEVGVAVGLSQNSITDEGCRNQLEWVRSCIKILALLKKRSLNFYAVSLYLSFATINLVIKE
jgi:hypothetical protein